MVAEQRETVQRRGADSLECSIVVLATVERQAVEESVRLLVARGDRPLSHPLDEQLDDLRVELGAGMLDELLAGPSSRAERDAGARASSR